VLPTHFIDNRLRLNEKQFRSSSQGHSSPNKQSGPMMMQGAIVLRLRQIAITSRIR
jgi:hypothetical protein